MKNENGNQKSRKGTVIRGIATFGGLMLGEILKNIPYYRLACLAVAVICVVWELVWRIKQKLTKKTNTKADQNEQTGEQW